MDQVPIVRLCLNSTTIQVLINGEQSEATYNPYLDDESITDSDWHFVHFAIDPFIDDSEYQ